MGRLLIVMPDELIDKLRDILPAKRGAISQFVRDAVIEKIEREYGSTNRKENVGKRGGRKRS